MYKAEKIAVAPMQRIEEMIFLVRGQRVMLDSDLAAVYGVATKQLNQQFNRNRERFPADFAFELNSQEVADMRSQIVTSSQRNLRRAPVVFTEHGAIMLASVLKSPCAVEMSVSVVRAFVLMREHLAASKELAEKLRELEERVSGHDESIQNLFETIRQLVEAPVQNKGPVGFCREETTPYRVKVKSKKRF